MMRTTMLISQSEAIEEARRCLGCYDAPCQKACPVHVPVPDFITRLREESTQGAGALIYQVNPLGATCGLACPTTSLCEGACVLQEIGQSPVRIGSLQTYATLQYRAIDEIVENDNMRKVAVIGAGPSGIGCAVALRRLGHKVDIFERGKDLGGLVDRVIPAHRLPHDVVAFDLNRLQQSGLNFYFNQDITAERALELLSSYHAVFLGVGLSGVNELEQTGENLNGVVSAMAYLGKARDYFRGAGEKPETGRRVVVVGGGNVALDAAVVAKRLGAERVIVLYRRGLDEMPGWRSEYTEAAALGVEFRWLSVIDEFIQEGGRVRAVKVGGTRYAEKNGNGRRAVEPDPEAVAYEIPVDQVIPALGQSLDEGIAASFGIEITRKGTLAVSPDSLQTTKPGLFAAGECVNGGSTIVACLGEGMAAGEAIHQWMMAEVSA